MPSESRADLLRALGVLTEPPASVHDRLATMLGLPAICPADWTEAFVINLVPHGAIYLGQEGMLGGEAADRIAGFWRALRVSVPADPDHLAALLGLYASLIEAEHAETTGPHRTLRRQARAALLHDHLLSWLVAYAEAMTDVGPPGYAAWARLLVETLAAEVTEVGAPDRLPAHLRAAPPVEATSLDTLLDGLLSPVRSGVILTRGQLAMIAREDGLGLRMGDRRRILRALVEQDPTHVLGLLADLARGWADRHREHGDLLGPIAGHHAARALATADLLSTCIATLDGVAA
jgi:TorA maturation chaperone TorD